VNNFWSKWTKNWNKQTKPISFEFFHWQEKLPSLFRIDLICMRARVKPYFWYNCQTKPQKGKKLWSLSKPQNLMWAFSESMLISSNYVFWKRFWNIFRFLAEDISDIVCFFCFAFALFSRFDICRRCFSL